MASSEMIRVLTFDVGGSHVSSAVCQSDGFRLGPVASAVYAKVASSQAFVELLYELGTEASEGTARGLSVTLAVPGPFDFKAGVSLMRHKLPYLYGVDLREAIAARFGCKRNEVRFLNDADAYLLGELGAGAGRGFDRVVGLTLGTGFGSAFAVHRLLVTEGLGVPKDGEIWNVPYESGIAEDYVSSRAITGNYLRRTGKTCTVADLAAIAAGDPAAQESFDEFGEHLGRVIGTVLPEFDAEVVVLGGGIARASGLFLQAARDGLNSESPELRVSELKDHAALVGCGVDRFSRGTEMTAAAEVS
jgi:glucokinase